MKKLLFFLLLIKCFVISGMEPNPTDKADFSPKKNKLCRTGRANSSSSLQNLWKKPNPSDLRKVRSYESGKLPTSSLCKESSGKVSPKSPSKEFGGHGSPKESTSLRKCESNSDSEDEETKNLRKKIGKIVFQQELQKSPKFDEKYPSLHVPTRFPDRHEKSDKKSE